MAKAAHSILDKDCSLDLHEATQLLEMLFFTFEQADNKDDWWKMREPIGSTIYATIRVVQAALRRVEQAAGSKPEARAH